MRALLCAAALLSAATAASGQMVLGPLPGAEAMGELDRPEQLVSFVKPLWPEQARAAGIGGVVRFEAAVDATGKVTDVRILASPHELLSEATIAAVKRYAFRPRLKGGRPQGFSFRQEFQFG